MAKNNRVDIRLNDDDYQHLKARAASCQMTLTGAVESLLRVSAPVALFGVRNVGVRGRRRVSVRFSNGMVVHGFLWSNGGQLLGPRIRTNGGWVPIVDGSPEFWHLLRELFETKLTREQGQYRWEVQPEEVLEAAEARFAGV